MATPKIRHFETDLCTGYKNKNKKYDWSSCCVEHDLFYWAGGTRQNRKKIDKQFKTCIRKHSTKANATIMYMGVKLGGLSPVKFKGKQWGNAWGNDVRKKALSQHEKRLLLETIFQSTNKYLTIEILENFKRKMSN